MLALKIVVNLRMRRERAMVTAFHDKAWTWTKMLGLPQISCLTYIPPKTKTRFLSPSQLQSRLPSLTFAKVLLQMHTRSSIKNSSFLDFQISITYINLEDILQFWSDSSNQLPRHTLPVKTENNTIQS
jgi:hypothetical protein